MSKILKKGRQGTEKPKAKARILKPFVVHGHISVSIFAQVMAYDVEDALDRTSQWAVPGLCHQCASTGLGRDGEFSTDFVGPAEPEGLVAEPDNSKGKS